MEVRIKDRKEEVEYFRMAVNMGGLGIDYTQAELILKIHQGLKKLKGKFTIADGVEIKYQHLQQWQEYFEKIKKEEENEN